MRRLWIRQVPHHRQMPPGVLHIGKAFCFVATRSVIEHPVKHIEYEQRNPQDDYPIEKNAMRDCPSASSEARTRTRNSAKTNEFQRRRKGIFNVPNSEQPAQANPKRLESAALDRRRRGQISSPRVDMRTTSLIAGRSLDMTRSRASRSRLWDAVHWNP